MIDTDAFYEQEYDARPTLMDLKWDSRSWVSDCNCPVCQGRRESGTYESAAPFKDYTVYPKIAGELDRELSDDVYLLLPGFVQAYVFRTRTWGMSRSAGSSVTNVF